MTHQVSLTRDGIVEVEYFGKTSYVDRAHALDALNIDTGRPGTTRVLVNFLGADVVGDDDGARLDFIAKAITHPLLENCCVALVGLAHVHAHPAETAGIIRQIKVRNFERRDDAISWLLGD